MKYALTFLVVVASLSSIADSADLEYVCTPAKLRWPNVPSACRAFDLEVYHDRVYVGSGDYDNNAGPCYMLAVDPYYSACTNEFAAGTEATETIRTFSDGRLYVPATDHMDTGSYPNGFWFRKELDGTWGSHRGIPGGVTGYLNVHNWDMQEFDGWIFSGGYGIAGSSNWGEKWTDVAPKATLARGYTVYSAILNGKPYDNKLLTISSKYEYRFTAFLTVGDEFYCLPKNRYYFDEGYPKMPDGRTVSEWNPPTIWHWDPSAHVFNCESNSWANIAPDLTPEDFALITTNVFLSTGSNYQLLDTWHATKFKDRCLYVVSNVYRPIAAMCAYLDAGELRASRISLPAGTWPRDFTVFGDAAYLLAVAYDSENQSVRHTVWKSTDGITFTEILGFDFQQPMESIEYHEGYFYFGVGPKGALPNLGTLKKGIAELSGGIYRAWLPQEPVAVVADASTVQVQEGGSASVSLRLSAAPSATVEVTGSVLGTDLLSVEKKTLVFTPQNWNVPQTLNVSLPENGVSEPDAVKVVCGVATNGTRGAFASVEATPCVVTAVPVGNERAPVLTDESFDTDHLPVSYTVSVSDFGLLNGVSPTSATVILSAYAEGSADPAVVAEKTVTTLNTPVTVAIDGIVKGAKYRFVAEVRTSSSVGTSSSVTARAPIGTAEELVDLTDDLTNYASKFGVNCHSGGADGTGAWDGTSSGYGKTFGGYSKPSCAIWEFVTPTVVNGMGLLSQISESGDPDRNPSKFGLYGANDTNNWVELVVCANEPQWAVGGEWRRVSFDNTTAYKFYKVALMGAQGPNSPWVVAQEAELYHLGGQPYVPPEMTYRFYHEELNIPAMHAKGITGRGVRVGVVDDGIYPVVIGGVTNLGFAALKGSPAAGYHGTSVSALIGSKEFGLAPDCEIWAYNSGNATGKTGLDQTIAGIWWCATNGCRVINMSFGFAPDMYAADLRAAFDAELAEIQRQTGVILINGNGNNPLSDINYCPQDSECVITIGGLKPDKTPAALTDSWRKDFCTFGDQVPDFVKPDGTIGTFDGTSCACPLATAIVALLLQQQPDLTQDEVYGILKSSAKVLAPGRTREYGWGLLQACEVPANYKRQAEYDAEKQAWVKLENITITNKFVTYTASDNFYEITMRTGSVIRLMLSDPMPANATDKTVYWYCGNNHAGKPILTDQILRAPDEIATVTEITINGQTIKLPKPNLENVYSYQGLNANYELLFNLRVRLTTDPVEIPENEDPNYVPADPVDPDDPPSGDLSVVYVAVTGSDSAAGTHAAPLLTISNAVARLGATGGKIIVGPGTFEQKSPVVVTAAVEIVGAGCGLDGTVMKNVGKYNYGKIFRVLEMNHPQALLTGVVVSAGDIGAGSGIGGGGGILLTSGVVSNCVVRDCLARQASNPMPNGGGVYVHGENALLTHSIISNCVVSYDASWGSSICGAGVHVDGGCVEDTLVVGCHVGAAEPGASLVVGGIMLTEGTAENCTVVNCWGSKTGGIQASPAKNKTVSVVNCVAFGCEKKLKDGEGVLQTTSSNSDGTASCFVNCSFDATAAAFADYANGDYRPAAGGVLVDAGAAIVGAPAGDLDGRPRVVGTAIDIGCYELQEGGAVELETPVLSGSSFGFSGTGKFSIAVENPVRGAYYTVFTTEDLQGAFIAESASVLCGGETLVLEMDASAPQKFAKIVVSTAPFAKGFELP